VSPGPRAILLTGTVGSGKTTLLLELGELLEERGLAYALVDLDWLAWLRPAAGSPLSVHDVLVENLRGAWRTFRRAGVERLVAARAVRRIDELEALRRALPGVELFVVRLDVSDATRERRLRARDTRAELAGHLADAHALEPGLEDIAVTGEGLSPEEVAREVLAAAGW